MDGEIITRVLVWFAVAGYVVADSLEWEIPDEVTVAFVYNPFVGDLFERLVERLLASVDRRPRRLRIVYRNPVEHERLMATGRFRVVRRVRGWRPTPDWSRSNSTYVYEVALGDGGGRSGTPERPDRAPPFCSSQ